MKINRTFIVAIIAFAAITIVLQLQMPKKFSWNITFSPYDSNPFGSFVFDSVLSSSMPKGYTTSKATLYQLEKTGKCRRNNIIYIDGTMDIDSMAVEIIKNVTQQGAELMIVTSQIYYSSTDDTKALGFDIDGYNYFNVKAVRAALEEKKNLTDSIYWTGDKTSPPRKYKLLGNLVNCDAVRLSNTTARWDTLAYINAREGTIVKKMPVVARRKMGSNGGQLIVVATPLVFSNYGMLEGETSDLIFSTMALIADKPVIRITNEANTEAEQERQSTPFRAIFQSRALTWAFYTCLVVLLLFFVFNMRRRQRAIPVIKQPQNHTLEFTRLIGTLFYQRHDNAALVRRKWNMFASVIRQQVGVDVESLDDDDTLFSLLSSATGLPYEDIAQTVKRLRLTVNNEDNISPKLMMELINKMNEILKRIRE